MKVEYFCPECGGTDVISQNWSMWNKEEQETEEKRERLEKDGRKRR